MSPVAAISICFSPRSAAPKIQAIRRRRGCPPTSPRPGVTAPLRDAIGQILALSANDAVLDAGCGDGYYLGTLAGQSQCQAHGIDISIPAIDAAARRYPACEWIVANADRLIPYADASFSVVMSITARMNPIEFRRVIRDDGKLLIALAAPDDLIELRGVGRDRVSRTVEEFAPISNWLTSVVSPPPPAWMKIRFAMSCSRFTARCEPEPLAGARVTFRSRLASVSARLEQFASELDFDTDVFLDGSFVLVLDGHQSPR